MSLECQSDLIWRKTQKKTRSEGQLVVVWLCLLPISIEITLWGIITDNSRWIWWNKNPRIVWNFCERTKNCKAVNFITETRISSKSSWIRSPSPANLDCCWRSYQNRHGKCMILFQTAQTSFLYGMFVDIGSKINFVPTVLIIHGSIEVGMHNLVQIFLSAVRISLPLYFWMDSIRQWKLYISPLFRISC